MFVSVSKKSKVHDLWHIAQINYIGKKEQGGLVWSPEAPDALFCKTLN